MNSDVVHDPFTNAGSSTNVRYVRQSVEVLAPYSTSNVPGVYGMNFRN